MELIGTDANDRTCVGLVQDERFAELDGHAIYSMQLDNVVAVLPIFDAIITELIFVRYRGELRPRKGC